MQSSLRSVLKYPNTTQLLITITPRTHSPQVYVIDAGKCKENGYDPNTRMQLLLERWVSRASAKQRRGTFIFIFALAISMTSRVFCLQTHRREIVRDTQRAERVKGRDAVTRADQSAVLGGTTE